MPLVPVALALLAGIVASILTPKVDTDVWVAAMVASTFLGGILLIANFKQKDTVLTGLFLAVMFVVGGVRQHVSDPVRDELNWRHHCRAPSYLAMRLKETPVPREKSYRVAVRVEQVDGQDVRGTMRLYLRKDLDASQLKYGDRLLVHGYADTARGTMYTTGDQYIIVSRDSISRRARIEALRMKLLLRMQAGPLPTRQAGVAEALTLGWKADIDPGTRDAYRDAGIAHLLAVSGLHVGLLAAMVGALMFWTGKERRGRTIRGSVQLVAVWGFALITGLAPSTVRAALMFSLFIVSNILGRRTETFNLLAASAIITLMGNPMLVTDTGWQLSYAAVTGILLARPLINAYRNKLWQSAQMSLAATLATTPITLLTFHRLHPYFLISNILIIPFSAVILALALLYMAVPAAWTAWPLEWTLRAVEALTSWVASLPGAVIEIQ